MIHLQTAMWRRKKHILHELASNELFRDRTRIVALKAEHESLSAFDRVVILSHGRITADGPTKDVLENRAFKDLLSMEQEQLKESIVSKPESINLPVKIQHVPIETASPKSMSNVLMAALEAGGPTRLAVAIITVALLRVAAQGQMLILGHWADEKQTRHLQGDKKYIEIMLALVVAVSILQLLQGYFLQAFNESVSQQTFTQAFTKAMGATKKEFWAKQPVGRIINRLSMDVLNIDLLFTAKFTAMSGFIFSVAVQQMYCLVVMPWWLLLSTYSVIVILCGVTWNALVPLQEKSLTALSKCHAEQLDASVTGTGARAYGCHDSMMKKYCAKVSELVAANFLSGTCMRQWIVLRICFCLCFQCTVCVLFGMLRPAMVGLGTLTVIVASTFNIVQELDNFVEMAFSGSSVAISLQRLNEYAELEQEAKEDM
jgi:ABC-type multidrug transport system fused ATPase/permease subunit